MKKTVDMAKIFKEVKKEACQIAEQMRHLNGIRV